MTKERREREREQDYFRRGLPIPRCRIDDGRADGCGYMIRSIALGGEGRKEDGMEEKVLFRSLARSVKLWKSEEIE